jgi:DNA-binding NarL/FixJ family response regulator
VNLQHQPDQKDPHLRDAQPRHEDSPPLRVLIVDDNPVIRMGLRMLLQPEAGLEVVAEVGDGAEALAEAARSEPDVVLLDVRMPGLSGLEVLPELAARSCVLMLTSSDEDDTIRTALSLGARGYLVYGSVDEAGIVQSIRTAVGGGAVLSPGAAAALLRPPEPGELSARTGDQSRVASPMGRRIAIEAGLTERECAVMDLLASGRSNSEIAAVLYLAPKTVKNHVNRIFAKLHVTHRAQAMALWLGSVTQAEGPS